MLSAPFVLPVSAAAMTAPVGRCAPSSLTPVDEKAFVPIDGSRSRLDLLKLGG